MGEAIMSFSFASLKSMDEYQVQDNAEIQSNTVMNHKTKKFSLILSVLEEATTIFNLRRKNYRI